MVQTNELEKIIQAYGKVLEESSRGRDVRLLMPESRLPYPKEVIRAALKAAIEITEDEKMQEQLKVSLVFLDDFVPDSQVPSDEKENILAWAKRNRK